MKYFQFHTYNNHFGNLCSLNIYCVLHRLRSFYLFITFGMPWPASKFRDQETRFRLNLHLMMNLGFCSFYIFFLTIVIIYLVRECLILLCSAEKALKKISTFSFPCKLDFSNPTFSCCPNPSPIKCRIFVQDYAREVMYFWMRHGPYPVYISIRNGWTWLCTEDVQDNLDGFCFDSIQSLCSID